jgi:hypothetical protein
MSDKTRPVSSEVEAIYREIQDLYGVPYVSAIHKSLATHPGFMEWAWHEVAPTFRTGAAQEAAWAAAADVEPAPLDPIPPEALKAWALEPGDVDAVRAAAETFLRVSPVNMMFAALLKLRLDGVTPRPADDGALTLPWQPPAPIEATAAPMVDVERCDPLVRDLAMRFASDRGGEPFVPGLYCMLLNWPGLAAHLATVLVPRMKAATVACDALRQKIDATAPAILMPASPSPLSPPSASVRQDFMQTSATYRQTSPELVVAGRLIRDALPVE